GRVVHGELPGVTTVVFDWGGTLAAHVPVDMTALWHGAAECLGAACGRPAKELGPLLAAADIAALRSSLETSDAWTLAGLLSAQADVLGLDVAPAVLAAAGRAYLDAWSAVVRHEDDAVAVLVALKQAGLATGLLSNTHWPAAFHDELLARD